MPSVKNKSILMNVVMVSVVMLNVVAPVSGTLFGSKKAIGRETKSCFGRVFNSKSPCFCMRVIVWCRIPLDLLFDPGANVMNNYHGKLPQ